MERGERQADPRQHEVADCDDHELESVLRQAARTQQQRRRLQSLPQNGSRPAPTAFVAPPWSCVPAAMCADGQSRETRHTIDVRK